ncbi:PAS domain-containing sensor histidine kinase [Aquimarina sp. ERC-38]|uniref:PAS domain-containing sensor histidine kinase n=1 Tax=Aquimarina sp. ERC-38 TaxID=2949996 RepID=UPI00224548C6|nr:PAS domain-containing sensor histidine kinase [Aquimarina sp. ERC-38]UZO79553.1 PAS domain-containing sensor histidine kinase [Aquimarina sp. ERC-38]
MSFNNTEFEFLIDKTLLLFITLREDGKILKVNTHAQAILGLETHDQSTLYLQDLLVEADKETCEQLFNNLKNDGSAGLQNLRFNKFTEHQHLLTLKFNFVLQNDLIYGIGIDSTEENEEHIALHTLSKITSTGAWHYNPENDRIFFSREFHEVLHIQNDNTFCKSEIKKALETMQLRIKEVVASKEVLDYEQTIITKDKKERFYRVIGKPILHKNQVLFINGTVSDVTERVLNLLQLKKNEETKRLALKGIRSGLFDHDLTTDLVFYSKEFRKMLGLPLNQELVHELQFRKMIHLDDVKEAMHRHTKAIQNDGHLYFNHFRLKQKDDRYRFYEVYGYRKKDENGKSVRMIGNLIDVHERRVNEQLVAENQSRLFAMINNGFTYTILLDTEGRILMADKDTNTIIKRDYGIDTTNDLTHFIDVMPVNFKNSFAHEFNEVLKGKVVKKEIERSTYKGSTQWLESKYTPIFNSEDQIGSVLVSFHDITEFKNAEISIKQAHIKEQELSDLKSNILSNFSHEIRTPLNGIITIINLLLNQKEFPEDKQKLLQHLEESKDRLLETMDSLSRFSEIDTIREFLQFKEIDLNYSVETSYREYKHLAKAKNLTYILNLEEKCPRVRIDETIFRIALNNIINNAIKYTNEGSVTVTILKMDKVNFAKVIITDTGIGIKNENLEKIFDPFIQESFGLNRQYEGTGIGLSLSKSYIELLGGTITVQSKRNKGTKFIINLPLII